MKRGPGKKGKMTGALMLRVDSDLENAARKMSKKTGLTTSNLIRLAITVGLPIVCRHMTDLLEDNGDSFMKAIKKWQQDGNF